MNPSRSARSLWPAGWCFVLFLPFFLAALSGCMLRPDADARFGLPDHEVRQAGALALYTKGLLLESGEGPDTNTARHAALTAFRQAHQLDPTNSRIVSAIVSNLADQQRFSDALDVLEAYLARCPADTPVRLDAARIADAADRPADAARHCEILLAAQPENRDLATALVRLHFQAENPAKAYDQIGRLHARFNDNDSAALPIQWAIHFAREGQHPDRALHCIDLALPLRTNDADRAALMNLTAEIQLQLGQTNLAFRTLSDAFSLDPTSTAPLLRLGALWAQTPDATNRLARLAQDAPDPHAALLTLAATHQALEDKSAAAATLIAAYQRQMRAGFFPSESLYLWLASLLESSKDFAAAERFLSEALAAYPNSHETQNFLAYMWAEQGLRLGDASRLIDSALAEEPENAAYLDTKGWVLFKQGRHYDALQFLLKAAELDKEEPVILDHVGDALKAIGRESEAVAFWTRSHQLDPSPAVAEKLRAHGADLPSLH